MIYRSCLLALLLGVSAVSLAEDQETQPATAADMRIMEPYIGEFRSPTAKFDDGETEYHHVLEYAWFDRPKTIVKFTISTVIPSQDRVITTAEGFYSLDRIGKHIDVFGAFSDGTSGTGTICEFNHATGSRTVCASSVNPDGTVTQVRDAFEIIDKDTWKNRTRIRQQGGGDWTLAYEGTYSRIGSN